MKFVLSFLFLILVVSCSSTKEYRYSSVYEGVDVERVEEKEIPLIENKTTTQSYGPVLGEESDYVNNQSKKVKALFLYPGAMNSITYLKFVDNLQKYKVEPVVYSGAGFGAVMASFLAKGFSTDHIEWKFFSLLDKIKGLEYYSSEWREVVYKFLKDEFGEDRLEGLKKALILPIYDKKLRKVRYLTRGSLYNVLVVNLEIDNTSSDQYQSPMIEGSLSIGDLTLKGVDEVAVLNILGNSLNFYKTNHYLIGLYGKLIGSVNQQSAIESKGITWFNLKRNNSELDRIVDLQELQQTTYNKNEDIVKKLREFFKKE
ncbi:hypothetical protein BIY24_15815 [Halobacteriovorax marinus]|uniref:patatin-like phospholipase family protein n=1 Tax=Halobacteriovorax marinus TaxID=97084 RepID=UPI000BC2F303|nr:patatin-like phospholipase family protein [Halobacteriovorax marinus]ATH09354.1 hypothetical protein BIY24_15815 [Halobacteriovorax marinus]